MVFEEGKLVRTKYLSSFDQYLNWRNTCALCIGVNKMVIYQDPANPKERVCSLGLKCYQIDVLGGKDEGRPIHLKYNMFTGEELSLRFIYVYNICYIIVFTKMLTKVYYQSAK